MPPARLQAIGAALEIIPLLPDDVVAYKIAGMTATLSISSARQVLTSSTR
jgi:hypothetical protein